ncbi:DNA gyrase inhibitor YacG [Verticiella sediminum]|uniref:DNA gyrase inhibitor YacG n=1 Tax=Verticiella sediminum TaxID=1247510 RepID=A0A556ABM4_9BURK|nr:DNA gyrase inhibitor YacG [Verticiella sediminum]TSH90294.1 DNA gyrase inhibitor YacG [Verticiella sediminum]
MATIVKCPTCRRDVPWRDDSPCKPFCSERCKSIDLGAWASNRYTIPGPPVDDDAFDVADPRARDA